MCPIHVYTCVDFPIINIPHQGNTFVIIDETIWTHNNLKNPWFTLEFTCGVVYSMGFSKCIMTCIHHCSVIQSHTVSKK